MPRSTGTRYIGIDVRRKACTASIINTRGKVVDQFDLPNDPAGWRRLDAKLRKGDRLVLEAGTYVYPLHDHFVTLDLSVFAFERIATRPNTLKAHRLTYRAQALGYRPAQIDALGQALFMAHFQQGRELLVSRLLPALEGQHCLASQGVALVVGLDALDLLLQLVVLRCQVLGHVLALTRDDDLIDAEFNLVCRRHDYPMVEA